MSLPLFLVAIATDKEHIRTLWYTGCACRHSSYTHIIIYNSHTQHTNYSALGVIVPHLKFSVTGMITWTRTVLLGVPNIIDMHYTYAHTHKHTHTHTHLFMYPLSIVCVCVSVHGSNLLVAQLHDKLVILTGSVLRRSLQNEFGVFRIMPSFRR